MTEIPEHLRKRAEEARKRSRGEIDPPPVPNALVNRINPPVLGQGERPLLPGEPFNPPLTPEERERIAVILVNLRASTDDAIRELLANAKEAGERAVADRQDLESKHRAAVVIAIVGTFVVTALLAVVLVMLSMYAS